MIYVLCLYSVRLEGPQMAPRKCPSQREALSESPLAAAHIIATYPASPQMGLRTSVPILGSVRRRGRPRRAR